MDQRDPRADQRPEPDRTPGATPEPTTPPSPVPPVPAYRPPRTTPFRTSAVGEGEHPDASTHREPGGQSEATTAYSSQPAGSAHGGRSETPAASGGPSDADGTFRGQPPAEDAFGGQPHAEGAYRGQAHTGPSFSRQAHAGGSFSSQAHTGGSFSGQSHAEGEINSQSDAGSAFGSHSDTGTPGARPGWGPGNPPPPPPRKKQPSLFWPLVLIFLGLFFLGQSLGLIHWSLWEVIWRLWPVWLIAVGLDMLFGRRSWGRIVATIVALVLVVGVVLGMRPLYVTEHPGEPVSIAQPLEAISAAEIRVEAGVSSLRIRGEEMPDYLIRGTVTPLVNERIRWDYDVVGDTGVFRLYAQAPDRLRSSHTGDAHWDLVFTNRVPVSLELDAGVGESSIDLSRLVVPELDVDAGVGQVTITLPRQGATSGRIDAGVGEVVLRVPEGRPARIRVETGLGGTTADGGFVRQNGYFVTPEYRDDVDAIDLFVSGGVGSVRLVTID